MPGMSPGTALVVREGDDEFEVHLCPTWYRKPGEIRLKKAERIKIRGVWAEINGKDRAPFDPISLDLLWVLAGQLAMIIENIQLFNQTRTLHAFNDDIIQNMTNGLIAINDQGVITTFNSAAAAMLGCQSEQVLHHTLETAIPDGKELIDTFQHTLSTGRPDTRHEIIMHHQIDGVELPISIKTAPLTAGDSNGKAEGVVGVLEDLSERKAMEAERRRLDRLAALGEMSAVVAHEIRNPVASIAAGVDYLSAKMEPDSSEAQGAAMIQSEIQRVNRILEDILFVARPFQLNLATENLAEIINDVIHRCQPQIQTGQVNVSTVFAADLPALNLDRQRLEQVFTNLIINATQAMQTSGQLPEERQLTIQTNVATTARGVGQKNGSTQQVIISFTDTGPGIPPDAQLQIFEPFFTTKARGTGLGLSVARRVVEEHKGTVKIDTRHKKGTRFIITLPIQREEPS
jgi:two-component system sensor histidine kinase AtoS